MAYDNNENEGVDPEETAKSWEEFLTKFKENLYPTFASFNVSFSEALMMYHMNILKNDLEHLAELLEPKEF